MKKTQLFLLLALAIGIVLLAIFAQQQQQIRSRAEVDFGRTFTIQPIGTTEPVTCNEETCNTNADSVHIQFNEQNAQDLLNSLP